MNQNDYTRKIFLFCFFIFLGSLSVFAQHKLTGKIVDATGEPIIGANVMQQGTQNGTTSNVDGNFTIELSKSDAKLMISYVGYETKVVPVAGKSSLKIVLTEDTKVLDDVVVVGYGTQKKVSVTGSIVAIDSKKLENLPTDNVSNMLAGRLPGVVTRQTSGMPGEGTSILIRGASTTSSDGSSSGNTPIYIVDGVQRDMINTLSPEEIQNITVLKDAASAAIYGVQGGAGVILITTKRGQLNQKPTIQFKGAFNFSQNTSFPKFLNAIDYMSWHNKARELDGLEPLYTEAIANQVINREGIYGQTDWFDELFSGCGFNQNYNLSVSGGNAATRYYVTGGYTDNKGIVANIDYNKVNIRTNIDTKINDYLKLAIDIAGYKEVKDRPASDVSEGNSGSSTSVFWQATLAKPIFPVMYGDVYSVPTTLKGNYNPIAAVNNSGYNKNTTSQFNSSVRLDFDVPGVKGLGVHFLGAYDRSYTTTKLWKLPFTLGKGDAGTGNINIVKNSAQQRSVLQENFSQYDRLALQPSIDYERSFGKHNLRAQVVYDQLQMNDNYFQAAKINYELLDLPELSLGSDEQVLDGSVKGLSNKFARIGVVSRVNYNYGDKYLLEALVRGDASVKFHKDNRWGYFPAVSAGWRISEEGFLQDYAETLNNLKLRGSWGITGNDHIALWQYLRTIGIMNNAYVFNNELSQALQTGKVPYYDITWEKSRTLNGGFEATLWNGLLNVEFDYFYKYTWDILQGISASVPPSIGGNVPSVLNFGKMDNRGFELSLGHRNSIGRDLTYNVTGNFAYNKNRLLQYNDEVRIPDHQKRTGHAYGSITGLVAEGVYKDQDDLDNSPKYKDAMVGDIKYKDLNGDGVIDLVNDRTVISEGASPKYNYALGVDLQYKWFDMSMFFQGAAGFEIALQGMYGSGSEATTNFTKPFAADGNTPYFLVENSWTPENPNAEFPRLTTRTAINQNAVSSTYWLRKGNYLRMKNLQIGCTIPKSVFGSTGIESIRIYGSGSNLFTFSKLGKYGLDPEAPSVNNGYYPQQRVYTVGINITL